MGSVASATPTYEDAIRLLNSTQAGYKVIQERHKAGITLDGTNPIGQMRAWLGYIGYESKDLDRLNVVHVAGTKGKGTTCAFTNAILEQYRRRGDVGRGPHKIGLYTSPHLVAVRERICINSAPISEAAFTRYFFEVWQAFEVAAARAGEDPTVKPSYFRFLTLLSFHVFLREGVDAAVYEVGLGGALDSTNVFVAPAAAAVTTLGIDHVETLGATIDRIAWHKAGVFKAGCPAFTVPQAAAEASDVVAARAVEAGALPLVVVDPAAPSYAAALKDVRITPNEPFQRKNAALAVALAATALRKLGVDVPDVQSGAPLPREFVDGLEQVVWRGRCEAKTTGRQRWYLDGAHTEQSLDVACRWFGRQVAKENTGLDHPPPTVLVFNQQSSRNAVELLHVVHATLYQADSGFRFQHAIFCTNITHRDHTWKEDFVNKNVDPKSLQSLTLQHTLAEVWKTLDPTTEISVVSSIEEAIDAVRGLGHVDGPADVRALITGSFHLVGGALSVLEGSDFSISKKQSL